MTQLDLDGRGRWARPAPLERLMDRFIPEPMSGCWLWLGAVEVDGYGQIYVNKKLRKAHRVAYEGLIGPVPDGLVLDHLCRVRSCVNPWHLEAVTSGDNSRRGNSGINFRDRDRCHKGHEFTPENTGRRIQQGGVISGRRCRACARDDARNRYWRKRS